MTREEKRALWRERMGAFLASGLSGAAWCREQGLSYDQFRYWSKRVTPETTAEPTAIMPQWMALEVASEDEGETATAGEDADKEAAALGVSVSIVKIDVRSGLDERTLTSVMRAVMASC